MALGQNLFEELNRKISKVIEAGPAKDVEKNVKALMASTFSKLDLVTREEFDIQQELLIRTREKLFALEARVEALERALTPESPEN